MFAGSGMPAVVSLVAIEGGAVGCWRPLGHGHMVLVVSMEQRTQCLVVLLLILRLPLAAHRLFLLEGGNLLLCQPCSKKEQLNVSCCRGSHSYVASAGTVRDLAAPCCTQYREINTTGPHQPEACLRTGWQSSSVPLSSTTAGTTVIKDVSAAALTCPNTAASLLASSVHPSRRLATFLL